MKELKFQALVNEIQKEYEYNPIYKSWRTGEKTPNLKGLLRLIYNYNELNSLGKIIVDTAMLQAPKSISFFTLEGSPDFVKLSKLDELTSAHEAEIERRSLALGWIEHCVGNKNWSKNETEGLMFVFWALLVLAVDQREKDVHLSTICDFSQMLQITDQEVKDLLELVKIVCGQSKYVVLNDRSHLENRNDPNYDEKKAAIHMSIKSPRVLKCFNYLIKHFTGVEGYLVQYDRENIHSIKTLDSLGKKLKTSV